MARDPLSSLPPGPPLPMAAQTLLWVRYPIEMLELCRKRYGDAFTLSLAPHRFVVLSAPQDIRAIFAAKSDEMHAGEVNRIIRVLVGNHSTILLDGPEHVRHRKLLMPAFHGERMRLYGETMAQVTRRVIETWPSGKAFSLHPHMQEITLQLILRTVFGADEGAPVEKLAANLRGFLGLGQLPIALLPMLFLSAHPEVETRAPWRWLLAQRNRVDALLYRQIAAGRADPKLAQRKDVFAMLLQARDEAGEGMSDVELRDELMTALAAGHESTATALAWAFERILLHPQVLARLREEIASVGGANAEPDALAALPYLDATIKEVLRMRPVLPFVARNLKKPFRLGGYDLPAGTTVAPCMYFAQRDPAVYLEPERFRPERFLGVQPDPLHWFPFGGGIRRCIGLPFALYEMKVVLATVLARCDLELQAQTTLRTVRRAITLWPEGGTRVRLRARG